MGALDKTLARSRTDSTSFLQFDHVWDTKVRLVMRVLQGVLRLVLDFLRLGLAPSNKIRALDLVRKLAMVDRFYILFAQGCVLAIFLVIGHFGLQRLLDSMKWSTK